MAEEIRALLEENRRLRQEARELRERVDAFERSRWWRLHPRRLRPRGPGEQASAPAPAAEVAPADYGVLARFRDEVVLHGTFTRDVFTHELPELDALLEPFAERPARILEIGCYEGLSSCFFLWRLPQSRLTCVDTFRGTDFSRYAPADVLEATFDANVARLDPTRVRKLVGDSRRVLLDLLNEEAEFDLVYVDGSHFGLDVLADGAFAWRLLADGGTLVFDDYRFDDRGADPFLRPGPAIDALLSVLDGKHELLHRGARLAITKTG